MNNMNQHRKISNHYYGWSGIPNQWINDNDRPYSDRFFDDKNYEDFYFDNFYDMDKMFGHENSLYGTRGLPVGHPNRSSKSFDTYNKKFGPMIVRVIKTNDLQEQIRKLLREYLTESDPKVGTGKKPKGSDRRLYTDENPKDTVLVKFRTKQDIVDTLNKESFKSKSHARQSQIINLIHQRLRVALERAKDPEVKKRLKTAFEYIETKKEQSKKKTQEMKEGELTEKCWAGYTQKGMKTMFGKRYPNCVKKTKK
jgi:hypothetical protein